MDIVVKNGTIVNYDKIFKADIFIQGEKIIAVEPNIQALQAKIIDASGMYVIPGGIDSHVHFYLPTFAGRTADNFYTGSRAAIWGGTTSVIDFVTPLHGQSLVDALLERKEEAADALTNVYFHVSPIEWTETTAKEMEQVVLDYGVNSFKIYMAYKKSIGIDDWIIVKVLEKAKEIDALVISHCENNEIVEYLRDKFVGEGKVEPKYHPLSRPDYAEAEAIHRLAVYARLLQTRVYAVHVSTQAGINEIIKAKEQGIEFYAETCPQYLTLTDEVYDQDFDEAAKFVMSPPLRKEHDRQALWAAIAAGKVSTIGTDHCSFTNEQKALGRNDFRKIPNGAGGVEHRLELLYTFGVHAGKISMQKFVEITSYNVAKIFRLKSKGYIASGYDADLVLWNPHTERIIHASDNIMNTDNNIYEGIKVYGQAHTVILGGRIVKENNKLLV